MSKYDDTPLEIARQLKTRSIMVQLNAQSLEIATRSFHKKLLISSGVALLGIGSMIANHAFHIHITHAVDTYIEPVVVIIPLLYGMLQLKKHHERVVENNKYQQTTEYIDDILEKIEGTRITRERYKN